MLSATYEAFFDRLLEDVSTYRSPQGQDVKLAACWPASGEHFTLGRGVLVVGRAPNGLEPIFGPDKAKTPEGRRAIIAGARDFAERPDGGAPLSWLGKRATHNRGGKVGSRSPFWRVARQLLRAVDGEVAADAADWWGCLSWSNLAKVAPACTGNPGERLYALQRTACTILLQCEVAELNPRVILILAGEKWYASFARDLSLEPIHRSHGTFVRHIAVKDGRRWLFAERPERHPETSFSTELAVALGEVSSL
jgi:hypothetical protein